MDDILKWIGFSIIMLAAVGFFILAVVNLKSKKGCLVSEHKEEVVKNKKGPERWIGVNSIIGFMYCIFIGVLIFKDNPIIEDYSFVFILVAMILMIIMRVGLKKYK